MTAKHIVISLRYRSAAWHLLWPIQTIRILPCL